MKCHYEILDVPRDAELAEIKSAYRKFALKWHPDKNLTNTEYAKEQFQLVQQAYEVLSDPQERAWYDKHREQILRGANSEFQDNGLDLFQFFTTTCFSGFGDDEKGFYTVYRNVFDQIIEEDLEFMEDKEEFSEMPRFGDSQSDYDEVVGPFYSYWSSYCTKKSYVWLDPHDIKEIRNRKLFKLIEKDNKKVRLKAKKERNEEVRNLVAFVRKRDKRVKEHLKLMEARILENRQKQEELSKQKRLERKKQLNESGAQAEWTKFDNVQSELEQIEKHLAQEFGDDLSNSEEEEECIDDLYCVACNKIFKTPKALKNHESSKKHKENVEILKEAMLEEEEEEEDDDDEELDGDDIDQNSVDEIPENGDLSEDSEESIEKTKKRKKKNKKPKNILTVESEEEATCDITVAKTVDSDDHFDFESEKKQKKKNKKQSKNKPATVTEEKLEDNENTPEIESKNKKKQRKEKKNGNLEEIDTSHCCVTCKSTFPSKNKLFDHLKKTKHGVYIAKSKNVK